MDLKYWKEGWFLEWNLLVGHDVTHDQPSAFVARSISGLHRPQVAFPLSGPAACALPTGLIPVSIAWGKPEFPKGSPSTMGFPGGSDGKASACNGRDLGSIAGLGRSPREGNGNPLQYSCLENSMDRGAW